MTIGGLLEELGTGWTDDLVEIGLACTPLFPNGPTPEGTRVLDTKINTPVGRIAAAILLIAQGNGNCMALDITANLILG